MFFKNCCVGPSLRSVEFSYKRFGTVKNNLINAVFITIEGMEYTVGFKSDPVNRIENDVWR